MERGECCGVLGRCVVGWLEKNLMSQSALGFKNLQCKSKQMETAVENSSGKQQWTHSHCKDNGHWDRGISRDSKQLDKEIYRARRVKFEILRRFGSGLVGLGQVGLGWAGRVGRDRCQSRVGSGQVRVGSGWVWSARELQPWEKTIWKAGWPWERGMYGREKTARPENTSGKHNRRTQMENIL